MANDKMPADGTLTIHQTENGAMRYGIISPSGIISVVPEPGKMTCAEGNTTFYVYISIDPQGERDVIRPLFCLGRADDCGLQLYSRFLTPGARDAQDIIIQENRVRHKV